jgi:hypothetical protein
MTYRAHTEFTTKLSPEGVVRALTDFSPSRPSIWPNIDPGKYKVHEVSDTYAVVTEGSKRPNIWARERYDWSQPGLVTWTVEQSDFCTPGSAVSALVKPTPEGGSHVSVDWQRKPTTLSARLFLALVPLMKNRLLGKDMQRTLDRVAEQNPEISSSQMRSAA